MWNKNPYHNLDIRPSELWALEPANQTWSKLPPPAGAAVAGARSGGAAFSADLGLGFFAGGSFNNLTDSQFANWTKREIFVLNTLLTYDMEQNSFTNTTTPFDPFMLNSLVYVPVGPKGILVSLGGTYVWKAVYNQTTDVRPFVSQATPPLPLHPPFRSGPANIFRQRDMDSIQIYDIGKKMWYTQRASGSIPRDRYAFCTAVAVATDNSSYNIIIHGGRSLNSPEAFADTYVLSLPAFEFFQVQDGMDQVIRFDHTCHLRGNKMFVLGGRDVDQDMPGWGLWENGACDPNGFVNIMDVNTFEWDTSYNPADVGDYLVHKSISRVIGGK